MKEHALFYPNPCEKNLKQELAMCLVTTFLISVCRNYLSQMSTFLYQLIQHSKTNVENYTLQVPPNFHWLYGLIQLYDKKFKIFLASPYARMHEKILTEGQEMYQTQ